jgi:hypothetical protein
MLRMLIHEGSHIVTALLMGGKILGITIMPGIQLYPTFDLIPWDGRGASINYTLIQGTAFKSGMIALSGSLYTAIVGYFLIIYAIWYRPSGWRQVAIVALALLSIWDIIAYSILPEIGLKHWGFYGGGVPEPMIGAVYAGISYNLYQLALTAHTLIANSLVLYYLKLEVKSKKFKKIRSSR